MNLAEPSARNDAGGQGGHTATYSGTGGSGGTVTGSGGSRGGAGGTFETGGTAAQATGGEAGSVAMDAGPEWDAPGSVDGTIDVPYLADATAPLDQGTSGSESGFDGAGGTGGAGNATGGSATGGGTSGTDAGIADSGGGSDGSAGRPSGGGGAGGTGGANTTGGSGGSSTATGGAGAACTAPKSIGGIACPGGFCTVGLYSGYNFSFDDKTGKSSVCLSVSSLCGAGTAGAKNPPSYTVWGAGFGFNLSPLNTATVIEPVQLSGSGVAVTVTSLPTGADMRVQVTVDGVDYCAAMTATTQTIPWTSFNTKCWAPTSGVALTGAPKTPNIQFLASSLTTDGSFDFCVTALSLQ